MQTLKINLVTVPIGRKVSINCCLCLIHWLRNSVAILLPMVRAFYGSYICYMNEVFSPHTHTISVERHEKLKFITHLSNIYSKHIADQAFFYYLLEICIGKITFFNPLLNAVRVLFFDYKLIIHLRHSISHAFFPNLHTFEFQQQYIFKLRYSIMITQTWH